MMAHHKCAAWNQLRVRVDLSHATSWVGDCDEEPLAGRGSLVEEQVTDYYSEYAKPTR
jgi:hypothetical protein